MTVRHTDAAHALACAAFAVAGAALCASIGAFSAGCGGSTVTTPPPDSGLSVGDIETFAGKGIEGDNGSGKTLLNTWLNSPTDVTVRAETGDVYVVDWNNGKIRAALAGADTMHVVAGGAYTLSDTDPNKLNHPTGVLFTHDGQMLVVAWHNYQIRRQDAPGALDFLWGVNNMPGFAGDGGPAAAARFDYPSSAVWGADSTLYVSDEGNHRIRAILHDAVRLEDRTVTTLAGTGDTTLTGDNGPAAAAGFDGPAGAGSYPSFRIATDPAGAFLYVCDTFHHRVRRIDLAGAAHTIVTIAGSGVTGQGNGGFGGDGGPATAALLNAPTDVDVDTDGSVYICDSDNNRIRRVAPEGTITTVAGTGSGGYSGDGGAAISARLQRPSGIALDRARRWLYIADQSNHVIREVKLP